MFIFLPCYYFIFYLALFSADAQQSLDELSSSLWRSTRSIDFKVIRQIPDGIMRTKRFQEDLTNQLVELIVVNLSSYLQLFRLFRLDVMYRELWFDVE